MTNIRSFNDTGQARAYAFPAPCFYGFSHNKYESVDRKKRDVGSSRQNVSIDVLMTHFRYGFRTGPMFLFGRPLFQIDVSCGQCEQRRRQICMRTGHLSQERLIGIVLKEL